LDRTLYPETSDDEEDKEDKKEIGDRLTLSFMLNLLDGVLETPGRILVITSNFPEKLDRALIRPGRIDVKIEFNNATRAFILDMVNRFYDAQFVLEDIPASLDDYFTPAEVMESLCTNFKDARKAIAHLEGRVASAQAKTQNLLARFMGDEDLPQLTVTDVSDTHDAPVSEVHAGVVTDDATIKEYQASQPVYVKDLESSTGNKVYVDTTVPMYDISSHFRSSNVKKMPDETWQKPDAAFNKSFVTDIDVTSLFNSLQTDPNINDRLKELRNSFTTLEAMDDGGFASF
jgi:hypothetical protein